MDSTKGCEVGLKSVNFGERVSRKATRLSILIFSRALQLLHGNRRALGLTGHISQAETGPVTFVPCASVSQLCAKMQEALNCRLELGLWEPFEVTRAVCERGREVLLRGFGLPNAKSVDRSRIVIVLEEILDAYQEDMTEQATEQPSLAFFVNAVVF